MDLIEVLSKYNTQSKCIRYLEVQHWPDGPVCPYCNSKNSIAKTKELRHKCYDCGNSYSVMVGTIFQSTKLPLTKWFAAIVLIKDAKKGISSMQLSRHLKVNKNTAWFLQSRIRLAMKEDLSIDGLVEVDETFIGGSTSNMHASHIKKKKIYCGGKEHKMTVLGMIEREQGIILQVIPKANKKHIRPILKQRIGSASTLITDGHGSYRTLNRDFNKHVSLNHDQGERKKGVYNLGSIEGFWALLKRAVMGVYHSMSYKHLQSYMDEIAFKFNHKFDSNMFKTLIGNLLSRKYAYS